jgi:hypothetical protein
MKGTQIEFGVQQQHYHILRFFLMLEIKYFSMPNPPASMIAILWVEGISRKIIPSNLCKFF